MHAPMDLKKLLSHGCLGKVHGNIVNHIIIEHVLAELTLDCNAIKSYGRFGTKVFSGNLSSAQALFVTFKIGSQK